MSKRKADHDFITNRAYQILLYWTHRFEDELTQLKKKKKNNTNNNSNNNNNNNDNNNNVHVNVFEDNRGPPMPDLMVRKIKEMMNMNDDNDDDDDNNNNNESFMKRIVWLGQKKIEVTDTNTHHNRLFFPKGSDDKLTAFCSDEENRAMRVTENTKNNKYDDEGAAARDAPGRGLYVRMVDGEGDVWREAMLLKWWGSVNKIVFTREWNAYVADRELKPGVSSLQLWCFRDAQNKLCFAVNAVPTTPAN
ncbi:hypothetical protein Scep_025578 [Stephania cephalantha]|uniref:TF-B3 domain-containing protein n=1 Tax=Stephania cephalantha TaxID=152367 RepID=A0AAP0HPH4_9MAGN